MAHRPVGIAVAPWLVILALGLITAILGFLLLLRARSVAISVVGATSVLGGAVFQILSVVSYIRWLRMTR